MSLDLYVDIKALLFVVFSSLNPTTNNKQQKTPPKTLFPTLATTTNMEKIIYKAPNHPGQHMPDVFIMAQPGMAAKYRAQRSHQGSTGNHQKQARESDMTQPPVALVDVVQSYEIFQTVTGRGFDGKVARPARADLEALFNTSDEQAIAEEIIMKGEIQQTHV